MLIKSVNGKVDEASSIQTANEQLYSTLQQQL